MNNLEVTLKPMGSEVRHFFQRARFFEQMSCAGNDLQFPLARELREGAAIEADDGIIVTANNEEGGGADFGQRVAREIRPATARDDRLDLSFKPGGGHQRRSRASTRAEKAEFEICDLLSVGGPSRRFHQPACEHPDVEPKMTRKILLLLLTRREQVKKQGGNAGFLQHPRDILIARTAPAAAAPVRKEHEPARILGHNKIAVEIGSPNWNCDCLWLLHLPTLNLQRAQHECNPQADPSRRALTLGAL